MFTRPAKPMREVPPRAALHALQSKVGNRTTIDWLRNAQAKLMVGGAEDAHEIEADRVARQVVDRILSTGPAPDESEVVLQRRAEVGSEGGPLDPATEQAIEGARSGGGGLDARTRARMEDAFGGADFGGIRLHAGPEATTLNERVAARAFTIGSDIFFRDGLPDTTGRNGQELLAHELTHTIQQGAVPVARSMVPPDSGG